jgi:hypothetical protein
MKNAHGFGAVLGKSAHKWGSEDYCTEMAFIFTSLVGSGYKRWMRCIAHIIIFYKGQNFFLLTHAD